MKLGSLKEGGRDGMLIVVSRDLTRAVCVPEIAPTLQDALDDWSKTAPQLETLYRDLENQKTLNSFVLDLDSLAAPLPRAHQFLDGSAYLSHVELARQARGATMPPEFRTDPLMYQGCSDPFLGPRDPIVLASEDWGIDFEAEVGVITDDVPMGVSSDAAGDYIRLLMLVNDVSLRNLIAPELAKGFGFVNSKPSSSGSPVAVTPDELGEAWNGGKINLPLKSYLNGQLFGEPDAGKDMSFNFPALITHAAKTRRLGAGTVIGSGTVSNYDRSHGFSCIVEKRMYETVLQGNPATQFLRFGDRVFIQMFDKQGASLFGAIEQIVERYSVSSTGR
jgi:fumarylacetoacetate (FAA) hydrolase